MAFYCMTFVLRLFSVFYLCLYISGCQCSLIAVISIAFAFRTLPRDNCKSTAFTASWISFLVCSLIIWLMIFLLKPNSFKVSTIGGDLNCSLGWLSGLFLSSYSLFFLMMNLIATIFLEGFIRSKSKCRSDFSLISLWAMRRSFFSKLG